jgi:hypothetical protein
MSEAYRRAIRDGDHIAAGRAIMEAVQGDYNSRNVHALYNVHTASAADRNAPDIDDSDDGQQVAVVQVNNTFFSRRFRR